MTGTNVIDPKAVNLNEGFDPKIAALMGQRAFSEEGWKDMLPQLKINRNFDDDEGNSIPPGTFYLRVPKEEEEGKVTYSEYYAKTVEFRAFLNVFQIVHYDPDLPRPDGKGKGVYVNKTIKVRSYVEELRDELGGLRCGKLRYKDREGQNEAVLKEDNKRINYRYVYGLIKVDDAVDRKGNKVTLDWTPVVFRTSRQNMWKMGEALDSIDSQGKYMLNYVINMSLERKKVGDNVFYHIVPQVDFKVNAVTASPEDMNLLLEFSKTVDFENSKIEEKYSKALSKTLSPSDKELLNNINSSSEGNTDTLENDFDDDIPF